MNAIREHVIRTLKGLIMIAAIGAFSATVIAIGLMIASSIWTGYATPSVVIIIFAAAFWVPVIWWGRRRMKQQVGFAEDEDPYGPLRLNR